METVTGHEFEQRLSEYLRRAEAGESFVVVVGDRSVAMLVPTSPSPNWLDELFRRGELLPPERPYARVSRTEPLPGTPGFSASAELEWQREERL
ncbi:MAG TPA: hypothetical protein VG317_00280 [Pseudonocardiaceae bacterium]|jgi:antitoxin (DNA-binding transcriptional repressor) of toxin-antitoxin stability system|nr:hypothetical protein [Pseudonocardiaceae bacterium]